MSIIFLILSSAFALHFTDASLAMKPVYLNNEDIIVEIQPIERVSVIRSAEMKLIDSNDLDPANAVELKEVLIDGVLAYKYFVEGRSIVLNVVSQDYIECGSKITRAMNAAEGVKMELLDHSKRICKDVIPAVWVSEVSNQDLTYVFTGNPQ